MTTDNVLQFAKGETDSRRSTLMFENLAELDAAIEAAGRLLTSARECGFEDSIAAIVTDIKQVIMPDCVLLLCASDGKLREAISQRYQRLRKMVAI
jgi:hypothetical protein